MSACGHDPKAILPSGYCLDCEWHHEEWLRGWNGVGGGAVVMEIRTPFDGPGPEVVDQLVAGEEYCAPDDADEDRHATQVCAGYFDDRFEAVADELLGPAGILPGPHDRKVGHRARKSDTKSDIARRKSDIAAITRG
ncbi:MAG: hypothetical protein FJ087_07965 [Deltaproteobacteria bacterium]|nr:hypothetical protein [Deltaproteobacteria bacterium]